MWEICRTTLNAFSLASDPLLEKENFVQAGQQLDQLGREFDTGNGAHGSRVIAQGFHLFVYGSRDTLPAMTHVNAPYAAGRGIQVFPSADIPDPQALAFNDDHLFGGLKYGMRFKVMPEVIPVAADHGIHIIVEPVEFSAHVLLLG